MQSNMMVLGKETYYHPQCEFELLLILILLASICVNNNNGGGVPPWVLFEALPASQFLLQFSSLVEQLTKVCCPGVLIAFLTMAKQERPQVIIFFISYVYKSKKKHAAELVWSPCLFLLSMKHHYSQITTSTSTSSSTCFKLLQRL